jgi:hypothetical protein
MKSASGCPKPKFYTKQILWHRFSISIKIYQFKREIFCVVLSEFWFLIYTVSVEIALLPLLEPVSLSLSLPCNHFITCAIFNRLTKWLCMQEFNTEPTQRCTELTLQQGAAKMAGCISMYSGKEMSTVEMLRTDKSN